MKMTVDLADAKQMGGSIPKNWYVALINDPDGRQKIEYTESQAPMFVCTFVVDEPGEYLGRHVFPPHRVMLGGLTKKGEKMPLANLCQFLNATKIEWKCAGCGFVGGNGIEIALDTKTRQYYCPNCKKPPTLEYDTDHFAGKRVKVLLDEVKGYNSDDMVNEVKRVAPLS